MAEYGTPAGFITYHTARGRVAIVADYDDDEIQAQLLVASEWIDGLYRNRFSGWKTGGAAQVREYPRIGTIDYYGYSVASDSVPEQIEHATYEIAYRTLTNPTIINPDVTPSKYKRVSIDGAISVEYATQSVEALQTQIPIVGQIMGSLLGRNTDTSGLSSRVVRA